MAESVKSASLISAMETLKQWCFAICLGAALAASVMTFTLLMGAAIVMMWLMAAPTLIIQNSCSAYGYMRQLFAHRKS